MTFAERKHELRERSELYLRLAAMEDIRRRYQFLLLRRIVMWCAIGITIAFALATEIGSLATFAGLITAGIAVAPIRTPV